MGIVAINPTLVFILMVFTAAILATWSLSQFFIDRLESPKRKLAERLGASEKAAAMIPGIHVQKSSLTTPDFWHRIALLRPLLHRVSQIWPDMSSGQFLFLMFISSAVPMLLLEIFAGSLLFALIGAVVLPCVIILLVNYLWAKRHRLLDEQLCVAMDFLARILQAGHSFSIALMMAGTEMPKPIGDEFRRCYERHGLGLSLEEALKEMAARVESTDFSFFATAVLIQQQTGGNLAEILNNISLVVRSRLRLIQRVQAITAEGRLTGSILLVLPGVMFLIIAFINSDYLGVLLHTRPGLWCMGIGAVLQIAGFVSIRRIVKIKV